MITEDVFRTSINIDIDIGEESFLNRYLPTPSHAESIIKISKGFYEKNANTSHIMIGPYGSGKSLLATVIANIVGKKVDRMSIKELINKFSDVHQDVYKNLKSLSDIKRTYIPIVLNGSYNTFGDTLVEKIQEQLLSHGIKIFLPTEKNNILATIRNWKKHFSQTFYEFLNEVKEEYKTYEFWLSKIESGSRREIDWFKKVYHELTSGAVFDSTKDGDFQENLKIILEVLKRKNIGLFIIHDEFGRFLQNLDQSMIYKTMQELQDVAEFVNRSDSYMHILLISHKSMSQYMRGFNSEFKSEFQRIEKRFATYYVESDSATYYRIVNQVMTKNYNFIPQNVDRKFLVKLKSFNLFQELNSHEVDNLIAKGCQPIHPVTLFLLPRISRVFGQNERTLFTYLELDGPYGFKHSLKKDKKYIYADNIFSYFFNEINLYQFYDEKTSSIIKTYLLIRSNLDARKTNAYRIIKLITLWEITDSNSVFNINTELISFATGIDLRTVETILKELSDLKFVRFNRILKRWELAEGSSVVVEELINEKKQDFIIDLESRVQVLTELFPKRFYLSTDYNDEKNITRFFYTNFISSREFIESTHDENKLLLKKSDGTINYVILEYFSDYPKVIRKIKSVNNKRIIFSILRNDLTTIKNKIDNYLIVRELLNDSTLLRQYKNLRNELEIYLEDYKHDILTFLEPIYNFKPSVEWFHNGRSILITNEIELEELISELMWELYPKTPIVMNDLINRFNVTGIQKRSLIKVIDKVLNTYFEENIGIEGQGPDYLIYATVIKNNGINLLNLDSMENEDVLSLRNDLLNFISHNNKASLKNLYDIANGEPYGIRPPLVPLMIVICLRDKWDQLMLYRNNMFVPALKGENLYKIFEAAENYEYVYLNYAEDTQHFLNQLEDKFRKYISEYVENDIQIIRVSSGLLNWLRSLPRHTQITNEFLDKDSLIFKDLIRKSEVNPLQSLEKIKTTFSSDINKIDNIVNTLESFHEKFKKNVKKTLLRELSIQNFEEKDQFIKKWEDTVKINSNLIVALTNSNSFEDFIFEYIGTEIKNWSDVNYNLFLQQLENDLYKLKSGNTANVNDYQLTINNDQKIIKKVDLSKKAEIIYNNINRILKNAGKNVPTDEINYLLLKLLKEHIK